MNSPEDKKKLKNIAIVAHIDAGKTSLSERLLYLSGAITEIGEVKEGLSTLDFLEEEQSRGITIEAGLASFHWKGWEYTLLDTPGHVDFENEVDTALSGVEGGIVLVSGTEGLEVQTLMGWNKLRLHQIPSILFLNKLDLYQYPIENRLQYLRESLGIKVFLMTLPIYREGRLMGVVDILNESAIYPFSNNPKEFNQGPIPSFLEERFIKHREELIDAATEHDDQLESAVLLGEKPTKAQILEGLRKAVEKGERFPVYAGSSASSVGVRQLLNGLHFFVPRADVHDPDHWGLVLRKKRWATHPICLIKLLQNVNTLEHGIEEMYKIQGDSLVTLKEGATGEIVAVPQKYLPDCDLGDRLGQDRKVRVQPVPIYLPLLKTRVELEEKEDFHKVDKVLREWVAADPSLDVKFDSATGNWVVATMGEVQLEVLIKRLERETGCSLILGEPSIQYQEKINSEKRNLTHHAEWDSQILELSMNILSIPTREANAFINLSSYKEEPINECLHSVFIRTMDAGVRGMGPLKGCKVELTSLNCNQEKVHLPLLVKAFEDCFNLNVPQTDVSVLEPVIFLEVVVPEEYCGRVLEDLQSKSAQIKKLENSEKKAFILSRIPLQRIFGYTTLLRSLSKGQGTFKVSYDKHEEVK